MDGCGVGNKAKEESVAWNMGVGFGGGSGKWQSILDYQQSRNYLFGHGSVQDSNFCMFPGNVKR